MSDDLLIHIDPALRATFPEIRVSSFLFDLPDGGIDAANEVTRLVSNYDETIGTDLAHLTDDARIAGWRAAMSTMGLKPSTYKSSVEQLARRALKGDSIEAPLPLVRLYCALSARYLAPFGIYDAEQITTRPIELRFGRPDTDVFHPLGSGTFPLTERIAVYASGTRVMCWAFNHRDSRDTALTAATRTALAVSESLTPDQHTARETAVNALADALRAAGAELRNMGTAP